MPLGRNNTRNFHRTLYGPNILETIRLLKRGDDQQQGTVRAVTVYNARRSRTSKNAEPIQGEMSANHSTVWHFFKTDLERAGVEYINAADRVVQTLGDEAGWTWQPESTTSIEVKMCGNEIHVECLRVDPPE